NPTVAGLERYGDTQLYVSRGAGAWGPPVRVGAHPAVRGRVRTTSTSRGPGRHGVRRASPRSTGS
ncbi:hypothetical protein ABZ804_07935, partial [Streptomyces sp. NPDC047726]|uniref:hypothetical protein n=1 Tax=Streptomyces sp. NPDC047726 TaxID=3156651 RepID=UPI0033E0AB3C